MKFIVVGASGFIGSKILSHVRSLGFDALGTQSSARLDGLVKFNLLEDRIEDCVPSTFLDVESQLVVVICAVVSNMDLCLIDRTRSYLINVKKTIQLIEDVKRWNAKIIFLSTCFVFNGEIGYYTEGHPISPANEYARQKVEVEDHIKSHVPDGFIARLDKIVGDDPCQNHLFAQWHQLISNDKPIVCLEGSLLSPTFVGDVAKAITFPAEEDVKGIFHVANSEFFYRDELARQFCHYFGKVPNVVTRPLNEFGFSDNRALKSYLDGTRFALLSKIKFLSMREVFKKFAENLKLN